MSLESYRATESEKERTADLLRILPKGGASVLEIGARDGYFSRLLCGFFSEVVALDLRKPDFEYPGVTTVEGDVTRLEFPDRSFDCVFCTEVLEHVKELDKACRELARVARRHIVVGVPFRQDTRAGRTTCRACGRANPPWGHVNTFDVARLTGLFPGFQVARQSFVGASGEVTNALSAFLMMRAGNPWGTYDQEEPCVHCGANLVPPARLSLLSRVWCGLAARITLAQRAFTRPHPNWIHVVFSRDGTAVQNRRQQL